MSEQQSPTSVDSKKVLPPLNPLALPAETDGLFRMLVAGSFLLTMYMLMLYIVFGVLLGVPWFFADVWWNTQAFELTSQTIADRWIFALSDGEMRELAASLAWLNLGAFFNSLPRVAFVMLFGCVLMLTSVILYRSGFARMIRRDKLRTLSTFPRTDLAARVQAHISTIARSAGFERAPEIVVRTSKKGDAQVFGHRGRYILRVDAAPLARTIDELGDLVRRGASETFRAMILHELGHIANQDVERSYYSRSLWQVFLALILMPLIAIIIGFNVLGTLSALQSSETGSSHWFVSVGSLLWGLCVIAIQTIALVLVMRAIWRALLRTREIYADWRAALWGAQVPLMTLLAQPRPVAAPLPREVPGASVISTVAQARWRKTSWLQRQWRKLWVYHPQREVRLQCIRDPGKLFSISPDVPFLTGVLFSFAIIGMPMFIIYAGLPLFNLSEALSWGLVRLALELPPPLDRLAVNVVLLVIRVGFQVGFVAFALGFTAYLVVGSLGRQVQRDALGDLLPERRGRWGYAGLIKPALLLAAGVEFGFLIIPTNPFGLRDQLSLLLIPVWLIVFALLSWFWLVYVSLLSKLVLGSHNGTSLPAWKRHLVTACSLFALWALYLPIMLARVSIVLMATFPQMQAAMANTPFADANYFGLMFGFSIIVLLILGSALFFLWAALTYSLAGVILWLRRTRCPCCGEAVREWIIVGRSCSACYQPLGGWLFVQLKDER